MYVQTKLDTELLTALERHPPTLDAPFAGTFSLSELNVRTYVTHGGKGGVYFFSLDAGSRVAAWAARATYHLPYFHAHMSSVDQDGWIQYHSVRDSGAE